MIMKHKRVILDDSYWEKFEKELKIKSYFFINEALDSLVT